MVIYVSEYPKYNLYKALGLEEQTHDLSTIKRAWKQRFQAFHSDRRETSISNTKARFKKKNNESDKAYEERMIIQRDSILIQISEAYNVLSNPIKRSAYNQWLKKQRETETQKGGQYNSEHKKSAGDAGRKNEVRTETYTDGGRYKGEFKGGKRHGQGTYIWVNGNKYEGNFKDGKCHGHGTLTYSDGKYKGEWRDGIRHGQGVFTYTNGNRYDGEFKNDKQHGLGTFTYADGGKYKGEFNNYMFQGHGTFTYANGDTYEGEWKDDNRNGYGVLIFWTKGEKYDGEWKDGKYHGHGTLISKHGRYVGEWKDGKFYSGKHIRGNNSQVQYWSNGQAVPV